MATTTTPTVETIRSMLSRLFAPQSLSHEPAVSSASSSSSSTLLHSGDIVLLRTPGFVYQASRHLLASSYDHAVVALDRPDHVLNIAPPHARRISACAALAAVRQPLVLRPVLSTSERARFVAMAGELVGKKYDLQGLYLQVGKGVLEKQLKVGRFLPKVPEGSMVCFEAILACLTRASPSFASACVGLATDRESGGAASVSDFLRLQDAGLFEEVQQQVTSPPTPLEQAWTASFSANRRALAVRAVQLVVAVLGLLWFMRRWRTIVSLVRRCLVLFLGLRVAKRAMARL
jgi:hypothetical protein